MSRRAPTIGVCGFVRCGGTMMMDMLKAGGVMPVAGSDPASYDMSIEDIGALSTSDPAGRAVKLLDYPNRLPTEGIEWRFIWLDRHPAEQALSTLKLMATAGALGDEISAFQIRQKLVHLERVNRNTRPAALGALRRLGPVEVTSFETLLATPKQGLRQVRKVLPDGFDWAAAIAVVDTSRGPGCVEGMVREDRAIAATLASGS